MSSAFRHDVHRTFPGPITIRLVFSTFFAMSLWAIAIFRFGKAVQNIRFKPVRKLLLLGYFFLYKTSEALSGIRISIESEIGPGLVIHNFGGVIIRGTLGANCTIVQGAQLISRADSKASGWPVLGANVYVGSGAKLLGNIRIGNNVKIGANAVVMEDVPDDAVVLPPQCRILGQQIHEPRATAESNGEHSRATPPAAPADPAGLIREALQLPADFPIPEDAYLDELPGWNSLSYLRLVTSIEAHLGRRLDLDETAALATAPDVERLCQLGRMCG